MTSYAIISLGGKQYRVQEGQRLLVDRLPYDEGKTFHPQILFIGGDGTAELAPQGVEVTARVAKHLLGKKIRIGKYKAKSGYKKHTGYRSRLSQVEIDGIAGKATRAKAEPAEEKPPAEEKAKAAPPPKPKAEKPAAPAEKKTPARKPAAKKETA